MMTRDQYVEKLKTQLDLWNAEIDSLEDRARKARADAEAHYQDRVNTLRAQYRDAAGKLEQIRMSSEAAWKDLEAGVEKAWADLGEAVNTAMSRMK